MIAVSPYALFHDFELFLCFNLFKTQRTFSNPIDLHQRLTRFSYVTFFEPFDLTMLYLRPDIFQKFDDQGDAHGFSKCIDLFDKRLHVDPSVPCLSGIIFLTSNDRRNE